MYNIGSEKGGPKRHTRHGGVFQKDPRQETLILKSQPLPLNILIKACALQHEDPLPTYVNPRHSRNSLLSSWDGGKLLLRIKNALVCWGSCVAFVDWRFKLLIEGATSRFWAD